MVVSYGERRMGCGFSNNVTSWEKHKSLAIALRGLFAHFFR